MAGKRDADRNGDADDLPEVKKKLSALERMIAKTIGAEREIGAPDDPAKEAYPELWKWLTLLYVGKDHIKSPASIKITLGPEGVLVQLSDRDLASGLGVSCRHLQDCFAALEAALTGPNPPIQTWGKQEPKLRKRRQGN